MAYLHRALEAVSLLGGEDLQPFYAMLEGGRDGEFFAELEEYFYYAQIRRLYKCNTLSMLSVSSGVFFFFFFLAKDQM